MKKLILILILFTNTLAYGQKWEAGLCGGILNFEKVNRQPDHYLGIGGLYSKLTIHKRSSLTFGLNYFKYNLGFFYDYKQLQSSCYYLYKFIKYKSFCAETGAGLGLAWEKAKTTSFNANASWGPLLPPVFNYITLQGGAILRLSYNIKSHIVISANGNLILPIGAYYITEQRQESGFDQFLDYDMLYTQIGIGYRF